MFLYPSLFSSIRRSVFRPLGAGVIAAVGVLNFSSLALAQNAPDTYTGAAGGNLSTPANWSLGTVPGVTNDAVIGGSTAYGTLTTNTALNFGSLDITDTSPVNLTLGAVLTLGGAGDSGNGVSGTATDLLYVATGSTLNLTGNTLAVGTAGGTTVGTFNIAGTASISSILTGTTGFIKTGVGTLTLSGANTITGGVTIGQGTLVANVSNATTVSGAAGPSASAITLGLANSANSASVLLGSGVTLSNAINLASGVTGTLTLGNVATATANSTFTGGVTGTGNVVVNNASNATQGASNGAAITFSTGVINNTGTFSNVGTGLGAIQANGVFGANLTGVVQNSLTSELLIGGSSTAFTGTTNILAGVVAFQGSGGGVSNAFGTAGTGTITLGDVSGTASAYFDAFTGGTNTVINPIATASGTTNNRLTIGTQGGLALSGGITLGHDLALAAVSNAIAESGTIGGNGNLLITSSGNTTTLSGQVNMTGAIIDTGVLSNVTVISGAIGANVTGITVAGSPGTRLSLTGTNSNFGGSINLTSGILDLDSATALGNNGGSPAGTLTISGGTLAANFNAASVGQVTLSTVNPEIWNGNFAFGLSILQPGTTGQAASLNTGTGAVTLGANVQVSNVTSGTLTIGGTTGGTGNLTLSEQFTGGYGFTGLVNNVGSITTTGAGTGAITFTGGLGSNVTNFTQGTNGTTTFTVPGNYTGTTTINSGTLVANFLAGSATAALPNTAFTIGGGGTLSLIGKSTGTDIQTFASTTFNAGNSTFTIATGGAAVPVELNLNGLTRNVGGTAVFVQPTVDTTISATNGYVTSTANTNGILGGWATVGNEFATNNGTNIVGLNTATGYTTFTGADATPTANYKLGSTTTAGGTATTTGETISSLNLQSNTAGGNTITNTGTLTLSSGGLLASESTAATSVTHSILGGTLTSTNAQNDLITTVNNATTGVTNLTVSSVVADATPGMSLTKSGNGTLILSGVNTYTGATFINGGIVNVSADSGLGTTPAAVTTNSLNFAGGSLQLGAGFNLNACRGITFSGVGGTIDTNSFNTTYGGVIAGSGTLTKAGLGTLTLTGANTFSGPTVITGGVANTGGTGSASGSVLNISGDNSLGVVPAALQQNALTINGGTLQFGGSFAVNSNRGLTVGVNGATFDTNGNNVAYGAPMVTAAGANVTKTGSGVLFLYGGGINSASGGYISGEVNSYTFLGGETSVSTEPASTANGATAGTPAAFNFANGATELFLGNNNLRNTKLFYLGAGGGGVDEPFSGEVVTFNPVISGTGGFAKTGPGTSIFTALNTYMGATSLSGGLATLTFSATAGSGVFYNGVTANALTLGGVTVASTGATGTANVQTFSGTTFGAGGNAFTIAASTSGSLVLNLGALSRTAGGVASFTQPTGNTAISATNGYTTSTTNTNGILGGYATVGNEFATNNGTNIVALGTYTTTLPAAASDPTANYKPGAAVTTTASETINSLNLQNAANTVTVGAGTTLTVASGGILDNVSTTIGGTGSLTSTNAQNDLIATVTGNTLTVSSVIADTTAGMSLTKGGAGTLKLTGTNTYTGATYLNAGVVNVATDQNLGVTPAAVTAGNLTFNGGTVQLAASTNLSSNRGITLLSNGGTFDTNSFNTTYGGVITGNGPFNKAGTGTLFLTGTNTYTGQTFVNAGVLNVSADANLGAPVFSTGVGASQANIVLNGGSLQYGAAFAINPVRTIRLDASSTIDTNGFNPTFGGTIQTGSVSSNALTKAGAGTLTLTGTNTLAGQVFVNAGSLQINGVWGGAQPFVVNAGATLGGIGTINNPAPVNVVGAGSTISAGSGNTIGMLTLTNAEVTLSSGSMFNAVVNSDGVAGVNYSQLVNPAGILVGNGATFNLTLTPGARFTNGSVLTLISNDFTNGGTANTFANTTYTSGIYTFTADYTTNPNSFDVDVSFAAVPEPSTWVGGLLMLGLLGYSQRRRFANRDSGVGRAA